MAHSKFFLDCLIIEDEADILSRNVGSQLQTMPRNIPEEQRPRHHRGGALQHRIPNLYFQHTFSCYIIEVAGKNV